MERGKGSVGTMQVLLVDDEVATVRTLARTLPWEDLGFSKVLQATSASQAITLFGENAISVVITDIRMPGMNGLEMIGKMREINKHTTYILLTGHSDFSYAQTAIRVQADDYLLKPISNDKLIEGIIRARDLFLVKWKEHASLQKAQQQIQMNLPYLRNHFFAQLLKGVHFTPEVIREHIDMFSLRIPPNANTVVMVLRLDDKKGTPKYSEAILTEYAITNLIHEYFSFACTTYSCRDAYDYLVFFFFAQERPKLADVAAQAQVSIKQMLGCSVSIVLSRWGTFPEDLHSLYQTVLSALWRTISDDLEMLVALETHDETIPQTVRGLTELYKAPSLTKLIESEQWASVENRLHGVFRELREDFCGSKEHFLETSAYLTAILLNFAHKNGICLEGLPTADIGSLQKALISGRISLMEEWIRAAIASIRESNRSQINEVRNGIIAKVQA